MQVFFISFTIIVLFSAGCDSMVLSERKILWQRKFFFLIKFWEFCLKDVFINMEDNWVGFQSYSIICHGNCFCMSQTLSRMWLKVPLQMFFLQISLYHFHDNFQVIAYYSTNFLYWFFSDFENRMKITPKEYTCSWQTNICILVC